MFDVGFSELIVIAVVALVVIGPERLPGVARTIGALLGRAQRYFNDVKAEVNRELQLDELRRLRDQADARLRSAEQEAANLAAVPEAYVAAELSSQSQPGNETTEKNAIEVPGGLTGAGNVKQNG